MRNRPALGHHTITVFGKQIKIFVCGHISGNTTAFHFRFRNQKDATFMPKSHRRYAHLMQYYDEVESINEAPKKIEPCWGIAHLLGHLTLYPVSSPSWEKTGKIYKPA